MYFVGKKFLLCCLSIFVSIILDCLLTVTMIWFEHESLGTALKFHQVPNKCGKTIASCKFHAKIKEKGDIIA
jgi:lipopolysaccharide/colanic/teichoic acid biosynthesis glycosyltransferase